MSKKTARLVRKTSRPYMPGYEGMFRKGADALSWTWAVKQLEAAHNYWLATVRTNRRPHVMPVWGVWFEDAFYFSTGPYSRKARNMKRNANCVVCPENAAKAIILEGTVGRATQNSSLGRVITSYEKKYNWKMKGSEDSFYRVDPRTIFGFVESGRSNPTRWSFA